MKSWTEFATDVKDLSQQRVDINSIKHLMRNVQRPVKDVSKMIYHSKLYQDANPSRTKAIDLPIPSSAVSPNPSGWNIPHEMSRMHNGYTASPIPSTPHSATLGPGLYATAATPVSGSVPREFFQEPPTARRYDTPMQYHQQQQEQQQRQPYAWRQ